MSGKVFEYLAAGRPILALVDRGVAQALIREANAGTTVHPQDVVGISDALDRMFSDFENGTLVHTPNLDVIGRHNRKELTHRLASLLDILTEARP